MFTKKAVVGIGILLIFVATILVSAIAAGVLITATLSMQESALAVSAATQSRLVTAIDVLSVVGIANLSSEQLNGLEIQTRLRAGSGPIQLEFTAISFVWQQDSFSSDFDSNLTGPNCTFENLPADGTEYCAFNMIGNDDSILNEGEILALRFNLPNTSYIGVIEDFEITIQPRTGALTVLQMRTPELMLTPRIRLR